jgi:transposase
MDENERNDAAVGPVVSAGGRRPSALSTGHDGAVQGTAKVGPLAPGQRWSVARKREVGLRLLRGESAELLSRELGLPLYKLEQWRQRAEAALEGALKEREATDPAAGELAAALQRIGELSMEVELLRTRLGALPQGDPALWAAGGRGDGRGNLASHRPPLRGRPRLPSLAGAALLLLCRVPLGGERRGGGGGPDTPARAEARRVGCGAAGGHPG